MVTVFEFTAPRFARSIWGATSWISNVFAPAHAGSIGDALQIAQVGPGPGEFLALEIRNAADGVFGEDLIAVEHHTGRKIDLVLGGKFVLGGGKLVRDLVNGLRDDPRIDTNERRDRRDSLTG